MIDLARRDDPAAGLRRGLAPPRRRLRVAALRRHAGPRAPARAVDHDADDARVRARRAARVPGRRRSSSSTGSRRCAPTSATPRTAAGSRRSAAPTTSAPTSTSSSCWRRRARGTTRCWARRWRCSRRASGTSAPARWSTSGTATGPSLEAYRGANANMHGVEAMLATEDPVWLRAGGADHAAARRRQPPAAERALRRAVAAAAGLQPRRARAPVPALRRDDRALVRVGAAGLHARRRPLRGRRAAAVRRGRARRLGRQRASSTPSTGTGGRSSPTGCTGCCARRSRAAAVLGEDALQAEWWELAERQFIDRADGSWQHELDPSNRPATHGLGRQAGRLPRVAGDAHPARCRSRCRSPQVCALTRVRSSHEPLPRRRLRAAGVSPRPRRRSSSRPTSRCRASCRSRRARSVRASPTDGATMYVSSATGLQIYDVSAPATPKQLSQLPLPHFENEDVDVGPRHGRDHQRSVVQRRRHDLPDRRLRPGRARAALDAADQRPGRGTNNTDNGHIANCIRAATTSTRPAPPRA